MNWVTIDKVRIVEALAADVRQLYEGWVVQHPDKAARVDEIIANLVMEFRAGIEANPLNTLDADTAKLPQSCVRHAETLIIFDLCSEIGAKADEADVMAVTKAEIFLRQMFTGRFYLTGGETAVAASPSYGAADRRAGEKSLRPRDHMTTGPHDWGVRVKRLWVMAGVLLALAAVCRGDGFADTYALGAGTVTVSNGQANSSWVPVAVLFSYAVPSTGTTAVWRVSQSFTHNLGTCGFTNVSSVIWLPDGEYSFGPGDVLRIESSVTNGAAQVIRRGG